MLTPPCERVCTRVRREAQAREGEATNVTESSEGACNWANDLLFLDVPSAPGALDERLNSSSPPGSAASAAVPPMSIDPSSMAMASSMAPSSERRL